jgi:hypothetical protein
VAQLRLVRSMRPLAIAIVAILAATEMQAARPPITIEGVFVDAATGRGIPNARVELRQRHWGFPLEPVETPLANAKTDKTEHFRFVGAWRGRFRLWCFSGHDAKMGIREVRGSERDIRISAH